MQKVQLDSRQTFLSLALRPLARHLHIFAADLGRTVDEIVAITTLAVLMTADFWVRGAQVGAVTSDISQWGWDAY